MLVRDVWDGVGRHLRTDKGCVAGSSEAAVRASSTFVEGDDDQAVPAGLKVGGFKNRSQRVAQETVSGCQLLRLRTRRHPNRTVVRIVLPGGNDDDEPRQGAAGPVDGEMR